MRFLALLTPLLYSLALADEAQPKSKRGLAYIGDSHASDNDLLTSAESPISWYYTWSLWPAPVVGDRITFVPLVTSPKDASDAGFGDRLAKLPASSTHLLTFNEPDGTTDSGGSALTPEDAARAYIDHIAPLRDGRAGGRAWKVSHPSVTGSPRGLDWLRDFNTSCWDLDRERGCPADFVAVHWYGNFEGLTGWLDQLRDFYHVGDARPAFWVTEVALAQQDAAATEAMMKQTLSHLDDDADVEGYAWFGAFRRDEANAWTGDAVSLFDDDGGLTDLGALYLGGADRGFDEGQKGPPAADGDDKDAAASLLALSRRGAAAAALAAAWVLLL